MWRRAVVDVVQWWLSRWEALHEQVWGWWEAKPTVSVIEYKGVRTSPEELTHLHLGQQFKDLLSTRWGVFTEKRKIFYQGQVQLLSQDSPKIGAKIKCLPGSGLVDLCSRSLLTLTTRAVIPTLHVKKQETQRSCVTFPKLQSQQVIELGFKPRELTPDAILLTTSLCC